VQTARQSSKASVSFLHFRQLTYKILQTVYWVVLSAK